MRKDQLPPALLCHACNLVKVERLGAAVDIGGRHAAGEQLAICRPAGAIPGEVLLHRADVENRDSDQRGDGDRAREAALPLHEKRQQQSHAPGRVPRIAVDIETRCIEAGGSRGGKCGSEQRERRRSPGHGHDDRGHDHGREQRAAPGQSEPPRHRRGERIVVPARPDLAHRRRPKAPVHQNVARHEVAGGAEVGHREAARYRVIHAREDRDGHDAREHHLTTRPAPPRHQQRQR